MILIETSADPRQGSWVSSCCSKNKLTRTDIAIICDLICLKTPSELKKSAIHSSTSPPPPCRVDILSFITGLFLRDFFYKQYRYRMAVWRLGPRQCAILFSCREHSPLVAALCFELLFISCSKGFFLECSPRTAEARVWFSAGTCQSWDL